MNIQTATKDQILSEILVNGELYEGLDFDALSGLEESALRRTVTAWIFESPEA